MIKLKDILKEGRKNSHCWLSPSGRVIPVHGTHDLTARFISPGDSKHDAIMDLWKKGYLRVTWMYDGSLVAHNELQLPNVKQLSVLKNIAMDGEHEKVVYDGGDRGEKILWSVYDTL
jgi:hypothetical protein